MHVKSEPAAVGDRSGARAGRWLHSFVVGFPVYATIQHSFTYMLSRMSQEEDLKSLRCRKADIGYYWLLLLSFLMPLSTCCPGCSPHLQLDRTDLASVNYPFLELHGLHQVLPGYLTTLKLRLVLSQKPGSNSGLLL